MTAQTHVLYHADCVDGFCSAWVANKALRGRGEHHLLRAVQYGDDFPWQILTSAKTIFIVDFSYKIPVLQEVAGKVDRLVVIDHHKSFVESLTNDDGSIRPIEGVELALSLDKSGARLTWEYFYGDEQSPKIVDYAEDRDLWRWALVASKAVSGYLRTVPFTLTEYDEANRLIKDEFGAVVLAGAAVNRYRESQVKQITRQAMPVELGYDLGHQGATFEGVVAPGLRELSSEACEEMIERFGVDFAMTWELRDDGKVVFSLRSRSDRVDVSKLAAELGGGGHARAAGFEMDNMMRAFAMGVLGNGSRSESDSADKNADDLAGQRGGSELPL